MYDLFGELLDRDELTEVEEKFVDALIELNEFWDKQENKEPRFLLDMDSICYGCQYFVGENDDCKTPQPCIEGGMNGYRADG
jgi:hypothetical protein